jgi:zinc transport system substrate-binding protein
MRKRVVTAVSSALIALSLAVPSLAASGTVFTVNYPLYYFADRLAGDVLEVVFPAPDGVDPAYWQPPVDTILAYQKADLVLLNGAGYPGWVRTAALPRSKIEDTGKAYRKRLIRDDNRTVHTHGPKGDHAHDTDYAFTTWLDIGLARQQAKAVAAAFIKRWPELKSEVEDRHVQLDADLIALEQKMAAAFAGHRGRHVLASHPVYQYLGRAQRIDLTSFHWEPGVTPPPAEWAALDRLLARRPATLMLWEGEPTSETKSQLQKRGVTLAVWPPLGSKPRSGDFLSVMRTAIDGLVAGTRAREEQTNK